MILDRMALADIGEPTQLASGVLKQLSDIPIPVPVEDIAQGLDITDIQPLETQGFEGGLIVPVDKSEGVILVNSRNPRPRRRFTVGHELGHFVNPWHVPEDGQKFRCSSKDMRLSNARKGNRSMQMEVEANQFAAELLMPRRTFTTDLRRSAGADLEHVLWLADRYEVSKEAAARRYVDLHDEPLAVVFSRNGITRYPYRNQRFPYLDVQPKSPLPPGCRSALDSLSTRDPSEWMTVDAGIWLSDNTKPRIVLEQTLAQSDGFRVTLLALDDEPEDDDDDVDLEESWTPRFRRK